MPLGLKIGDLPHQACTRQECTLGDARDCVVADPRRKSKKQAAKMKQVTLQGALNETATPKEDAWRRPGLLRLPAVRRRGNDPAEVRPRALLPGQRWRPDIRSPCTARSNPDVKSLVEEQEAAHTDFETSCFMMKWTRSSYEEDWGSPPRRRRHV